ncbi:MAG: thioesterase, partial [Caulobacteraceae bacterium]|nr:thioesterase [Caulobacteraceae bacterium]
MSEEDPISGQWIPVTEGEWAGWLHWPSDNWEVNGGPFYFRREANGTSRCAFRAEAKHMNGQGHMHGGALMTFADYSMFGIAAGALAETAAVTVSLTCEFIGGAHIGDLLEATGEIIRQGRTLIFQR